jgi:tRNA (guanine-N7-)-methyltransferase
MGRRALRKIDPQLDLAPYLKTADDLPDPFDSAELFGREAPLEVEVGSGKGLFLASTAAATLEHNFLGVEVAAKYARFAASRLAKQDLDNALILHGDGLALFRDHLPDASLAAVHVYFPDPWWKKRHHKRRVMNESFLASVVRTLAPGGSLHFWTDVQNYFDASLELIARLAPLAGPLDVPERPAEHDLDYRTHFERRTRLSDLPVYRAEFRKRD